MASLVFIQRRFLTKEKKSIFKNIFSEKGGYTLHSHIVQIGDPILRLPTQTVEKSAIKSEKTSLIDLKNTCLKSLLNFLKFLLNQHP